CLFTLHPPRSTLFPYTTLFRSRLALQPLPGALRQCLRPLSKARAAIHAEDEVDSLRPTIEVTGQREIDIAADADSLGMRLQLLDRSVDPPRCIRMADHIPRPVDHVEHLLRVGQRDDQRRVPPDALVGQAHACLSLPGRRSDRAVDVEVRD